MRIFNKWVEDNKEPTNKNDIWVKKGAPFFYKLGKWVPFDMQAIPTPDWEAHSDEDGHIKNRTHFIKDCVRLTDAEAVFEESLGDEFNTKIYRYRFPYSVFEGNVVGIRRWIDTTAYSVSTITYYDKIVLGEDTGWIGPSLIRCSFNVEEDEENYEYLDIVLRVENADSQVIKEIEDNTWFSTELDNILQKIPDIFIPNTIARKSDIIVPKTEYEYYVNYCNKLGIGENDLLFSTEDTYFKYKAAKDNFTGSPDKLNYDYYDTSVTWEEYGITWHHIVALKERFVDWGWVLSNNGPIMSVAIKGEDEDYFVLQIDLENETVLNNGY